MHASSHTVTSKTRWSQQQPPDQGNEGFHPISGSLHVLTGVQVVIVVVADAHKVQVGEGGVLRGQCRLNSPGGVGGGDTNRGGGGGVGGKR